MQGRTEEDIQATVLQAKKEMAEFSHNGRFWDYHRILEIFGAANPLASLLEEMEKKGLVVRNIPPILHTPASFTHSSTRDAEREPPTVEPEEPEPASDENSEEYYQSNGPRWTDDVRVEMVKKGLYKKHSIKHHLLDGFYHYLCVDLGNRKCKQEVENVSRFMYFMNSEEPSLLFVQDVEKVREYFNILSQTQLSKQTVLNYWKSLKRFMKYILTSTSLRSKDKSLYTDCRDFIDRLDGIRARMSKKLNAVARLMGHTPETAKKQYNLRTPADPFLALRVIEDIVGKARPGSSAEGGCREQRMDETTAFDMLVQSCPVTLDGSPPKKAKRHQLCGEHERHCYDRWRSEQLKLRESSALEHFGRHQPSETGIEAWIRKQGWTSNLPKATLILRQWEARPK
ncbi:uncharacterized protein [Misgurnus anguillicaudatus]|uniref:uncharacterized protein n=1 Tax=Misgurnus anguillicaudatus TaxID=75329 RepID=UPI003CCFA58C